MSVHLGALTWPELEARLGDEPGPVVFLVLGAVEAHGPHLPLETDTIIGVELAHRAARHLREETGVPGLVAPPITTTAATCAAAFPGTVSVPPEVETSLVSLWLDALHGAGARRTCIVTLHFDPDHLRAVRAVLGGLPAERAATVCYPDLTRREHARRIGGEFATGDCHAGAFETSLVLAVAPDQVGDVYRELPENAVGLVQGIRDGKASFEALGMPEAYCGAPAEATVEEGQRLYDAMAGIVVEACREAWGL